MANAYADMIIALGNVYPNSVTVLESLRAGKYDLTTLDAAKKIIADYKIYANLRLALEQGPSSKKNLLDCIIVDLGEPVLYIEKNVALVRLYLSVYDPTYKEPV